MSFRKKEQHTNSDFNKIIISLASPEDVLNKSNGEVLKPNIESSVD